MRWRLVACAAIVCALVVAGNVWLLTATITRPALEQELEHLSDLLAQTYLG